jgi:hypothetical protein
MLLERWHLLYVWRKFGRDKASSERPVCRNHTCSCYDASAGSCAKYVSEASLTSAKAGMRGLREDGLNVGRRSSEQGRYTRIALRAAGSNPAPAQNLRGKKNMSEKVVTLHSPHGTLLAPKLIKGNKPKPEEKQ